MYSVEALCRCYDQNKTSPLTLFLHPDDQPVVSPLLASVFGQAVRRSGEMVRRSLMASVI